MSVVVERGGGVLLGTDDAVHRVTFKGVEYELTRKQELHHINVPLYRWQVRDKTQEQRLQQGSIRKKRKKREDEDGETAQTNLSRSELDVIDKVVRCGKDSGFFLPDLGGDNQIAEAIAHSCRGCGSGLAELSSLMKEEALGDPVRQDVRDGGDLAGMDEYGLVNSILVNNTPRPLALPSSLTPGFYVIPPTSTAILSDLAQAKHLLLHEASKRNKFNLMVIDPPWNNKSVKRQKKYEWLEVSHLISHLPLPSLYHPDGCVVLLWATNNPTLLHTILHTLLPAWNLTHISTLVWAKVTRVGEFVCRGGSQGGSRKQPYERLIISSSRQDKLNEMSVEGVGALSALISVPSILHSVKPCLNDLADRYFPGCSSRLELFARNLSPGWTSWGNEVIKHQHVNYFHAKSCDG